MAERHFLSAIKPNALQKERLKTITFSIILSGLISGFFLLILTGIKWDNFLFGFIIGIQAYAYISIFSFYIQRRLWHWNLFFYLIITALSHIILLGLAIFAAFEVFNSFQISFSMFFRIVEGSSGLVIKGLVFGFALSLLFQVYEIFDTLLGKNLFFRILLGKYDKPFDEKRVFLFLDIESSTYLAEKLGHKQFLSFLNDFFSELAEPVTATGGEIYKYVGDEAIISWDKKKAGKHSAPLCCYFRMKQNLERKSSQYVKKYGHIPGFRAAVHGGTVVTGKMGQVKKEIAYIGDVLNTTARMLDICRELKCGLLASSDALEIISPSDAYQISPIRSMTLRGKESPVGLASIDMA